jgi:hypothetical protein
MRNTVAPNRNLVISPDNMGQGSSGNVIAAFISFFIPGLGQLVQGRFWAALRVLIIAGVFWLLGFITFGLTVPIGHILAALDAALWRRPGG